MSPSQYILITQSLNKYNNLSDIQNQQLALNNLTNSKLYKPGQSLQINNNGDAVFMTNINNLKKNIVEYNIPGDYLWKKNNNINYIDVCL